MRLRLNEATALAERRFDVCIVGAGAAGITLARKLAQAGKTVALCEGGDIEYTQASQDIYTGKVVGDPYFELDASRLRFFGGSTNHWGGMARVFDAIDFERDYLGPEFQWPIRNADITPYLAEACDIVEIGREFVDEVVDAEAGIQRIDIKFSEPVNFLDKYLDEVTEAARIHLVLEANLVDMRGDNGAAEAAVFEDYAGRRLEITADRFVMAMGGIENPRLLMWLEETRRGALFAAGLPLGRYWMEHPHFVLGEAIVTSEVEAGEYYSLTPGVQRAHGLLNARFELDRQGNSITRRMANEILCVAPGLGGRILDLANKNLVCGVRLRSSWEQAPDASNRVVLSQTRDRFGMPLGDLHWRKTALDRETVTASLPLFSDWLIARDLGRVKPIDWLVDGTDYPANDDRGGNHHMGGTRMGTRRDISVVDGNSRLHGSQNIYVAGSSVFTTGGHANPTLPLLQFTLRLADHLAG